MESFQFRPAPVDAPWTVTPHEVEERALQIARKECAGISAATIRALFKIAEEGACQLQYEAAEADCNEIEGKIVLDYSHFMWLGMLAYAKQRELESLL